MRRLFLLATLLSACVPSAQTRLCVALGAAGAGLTASSEADRALLRAELNVELDRACGSITDQTQAVTCAEQTRARITEAHHARYEILVKGADAQHAAIAAHDKDCR